MYQNKKYKILVVDDDPDVREFLSELLKRTGFNVFSSGSAEDAIHRAREIIPHLVLLDIVLPDMDGIEACEEMRKVPALADTVIAYITGQGEDYTKIAGYDAGADDYIAKPLIPKVFIRKVKALLRRFNRDNMVEIDADREVIHTGDLVIDKNRYIVIKDSEEIIIPKKEFEILMLLVSTPGRIFPVDEILKEIWEEKVIVTNNNVYVHIKNLRRLIGKEIIETVKGRGYRFSGKKSVGKTIARSQPLREN